MNYYLAYLLVTMALQVVDSIDSMRLNGLNCTNEGQIDNEWNCIIDGQNIKINVLPKIYIIIKCFNDINYSKLPNCGHNEKFQSITFKDCPLPQYSFKKVLTNLGVAKTVSLIYQNSKKTSGDFDRSCLAGLEDLTKLSLSLNGIKKLPNDVFIDVENLRWLHLRSNSINISKEIFKPLTRLETLEICHNQKTNISSNLFSNLSHLRKISLWQNNITMLPEDSFSKLRLLQELELSSSEIKHMPALIFKPLVKLKKLTLFSSKLRTLTSNLLQSNKKLETVSILSNDVKLRELPGNLFSNLPNLMYISVQKCGLEIVPHNLFTKSVMIKNISLAYNDIETLHYSVFFYQINLVELDLSFNKLMTLDLKLFSSLTNLERLNLRNNSLEEISGNVFSSLSSLSYINLNNNYLKIISSDMFSYNKRKITISVAYNRLNFGIGREIYNESKNLPFDKTFSLQLLNLSHNDLEFVSRNIWLNGHHVIDISFNKIMFLWKDNNFNQNPQNKTDFVNQMTDNKLVRKVFVSHNPFFCDCENIKFFDFLQQSTKTEIADMKSINCSKWLKLTCYTEYTFYALVTLLLVIGLAATTVSTILCQNRIYITLKTILLDFHEKNIKAKEKTTIFLKYCKKDQEFVIKHLVPGWKYHKKLKRFTCLVIDSKEKYKNKINETKNSKIIVVFTSNYLTSEFSDIEIKKIQEKIVKATNIVHIFVENNIDNSIFAFLKDQRDQRTTVLWGETDFWKKISTAVLTNDQQNCFKRISKKGRTNFIQKLNVRKSGSKLYTYSQFNTSRLSQSQV